MKGYKTQQTLIVKNNLVRTPKIQIHIYFLPHVTKNPHLQE